MKQRGNDPGHFENHTAAANDDGALSGAAERRCYETIAGSLTIMNELSEPVLTFDDDFDERAAFEVELKGYYSLARVCLPDGARFRVCFYDPVRLSQDLEDEVKSGAVCIAEPGLIITYRASRVKIWRKQSGNSTRSGISVH